MTVQDEPMVIVGAGLAGAKGAEALRQEGFEGRIILIGQEPERPYERPDLSKDYLTGASEKEKIYVHPEPWYADHGVELRLSTRVTGIDTQNRLVDLERTGPVRYDKLLITTGASARLLPVPGADPHREYYLRRVEDSQQLRFILQSAHQVVVVGGGWIGLEVAAAARAAGAAVTVLEREELPLLRVLGREMAQVFADLHRDHGVGLRCGVQIAEVTGHGRKVTGVRLVDGTWIEADAVVAGVGTTPNTDLAADAGLAVDDGIIVDEHLRTSDPHIFAAGDVANARHPLLGRHLRVGHWANALHQPAVAAKSMLGIDAAYGRLPYFFTDQYDVGMEYYGHAGPGDYDKVVVRGNVDKREFLAFWLRNGVTLAGMNVNIWDVTEQIHALVASKNRSTR
ncbi:FAD-dependent oxidoreductase [Arthrobacter sp. H20]|uniref:NAD(P)/FAD-dependent oxidoreductase n=1 Tax=Arthrobacter sp. H20 TaxID=1267981 RepID=UPI001C1E73DD|nr:FAD-dependent oxidoreductase [Arthrobacter sp. H20]